MTRKVLFCDVCNAEIRMDQSSPTKYTMTRESPLGRVALSYRVFLVTDDSAHLDICRDCLKEIKLTY